MAAGTLSLAVGISKLEIGVVGDGVPSAAYVQYYNVKDESVIFDFPPPEETNLMIEEQQEPYYTLDNAVPVAVEFSIYGLTAAEKVILMGGVATSKEWASPVTRPEIFMSVKITTDTNKEGDYTEYEIVNAKLMWSYDTAPGKKTGAAIKFRCVKQAAITALGVHNTGWIETGVTPA